MMKLYIKVGNDMKKKRENRDNKIIHDKKVNKFIIIGVIVVVP